MAPKRKSKDDFLDDGSDDDDFVVVSDDDDSPKKKKKAAPAKKAAAAKPAPASKKAKTKMDVKDLEELPGWEMRPPSLLIYAGTAPGNSKIAAFDLDGTLVHTKTGDRFARGPDDWRHFNANVVPKLTEYHEQGYKIVIFSNQGGVKSAINGKASYNVRARILNCTAALRTKGIPIQAFCATMDDDYRKPSKGMWDLMVSEFNGGVEPDYDSCFFVGDMWGDPNASGDLKDRDSDKKFAENIGITFRNPDEEFGGGGAGGEGEGGAAAGGAAAAGSGPNAALVAVLRRIADLYRKDKSEASNVYKVKPYALAADALETGEYKDKAVKSGKEVSVKGVGDKTKKMITDFIATGKCELLEELEAKVGKGLTKEEEARREKMAEEVHKDAFAFM